MNFQSLTNSNLLTEIKTAVLEERKATTKVLHLLKQVEKRRLYAERGYSSLFVFAVEYLGYSAAAAHRRISAMRALKEIPQIEEKILSGELSLSNIAQAQVFFREESKIRGHIATEEKLKLFEQLEKKSARECEKILLAKSPEAMPQSKRREITETKTELRVVLNENLIKQLDRLKALWSHKMPNMTDAGLIAEMAKFCLEKTDPLHKPVKQNLKFKNQEKLMEDLNKEPLPTSEVGRSRYIPTSVKNYVRDGGECQYCDPFTGKKCDSNKFLQIDHRDPWVLCGSNCANNLQLLCGTHNKLKAAKTFEKARMRWFK